MTPGLQAGVLIVVAQQIRFSLITRPVDSLRGSLHSCRPLEPFAAGSTLRRAFDLRKHGFLNPWSRQR